jgi:hypothetical protein
LGLLFFFFFWPRIIERDEKGPAVRLRSRGKTTRMSESESEIVADARRKERERRKLV